MHWETRLRAHGTASTLALVAVMMLAALALNLMVGGPPQPAAASLEEGNFLPQVLIGNDDDNLANGIIQPADTAANQSLNNADVLRGAGGHDVLIGLLGSDVLQGGFGNDILVGGTEQGSQPNSDIMFGDAGNDVALWAPGDGSDAFIGGQGSDAEVFGVIDRENNVPTLTGQAPGYPQGIPTANVSGQGGFCTLERVTDPNLGYEWLARFFVRATGNLAVTIRLSEVEQVFCTSQAGGAITYADLTQPAPQFVEVSLEQVKQINPLVGAMIR